MLYDTDGARYDIMTTNFAEVYNWVMRGVRGLPLVAIVEFIVYGCTDYLRDRFKKKSGILTRFRTTIWVQDYRIYGEEGS